MRAFMSPVFDRAAAVNGRDVAIFADLARVPVHAATADGWARESQRELDGILAETEPDTDPWALALATRAGRGAMLRSVRQLTASGRAALVESLAAFVEVEL